MTANERRAEIMRIMTARRQESMGRLALELGNILSCEQQRVLSELIGNCDAYQANVLRQMLTEYSSFQHRTMKGRSG